VRCRINKASSYLVTYLHNHLAHLPVVLDEGLGAHRKLHATL